jgi:hypothetical protein
MGRVISSRGVLRSSGMREGRTRVGTDVWSAERVASQDLLRIRADCRQFRQELA